MGKHVCPVCEDVYAVPTAVVLATASASFEIDGWGCPACGYAFIEVSEAAEAAEALGDVSVAATAKMASSEVRYRPDVVSRLGEVASS